MKTNKRPAKRSQAVKKTLFVCSSALLLANSAVGVLSVVHQQQGVQASTVKPQVGLADISILANANLQSTTGNNMLPNAQGNFDLSLKYSGTGLASVGLADKKVLVYALPAELQGKVVGGATVNISANLLPITPGDVPGVGLVFEGLELAINTLDALHAIPAVKAAFAQLKTAQSIGAYTEQVTGSVSPDGKYIAVDFTQGLGNYVNQAYVALFHAVRDAINAVEVNSLNIPAVTALEALKVANNKLFDVLDLIANGTSNILNEAINGNILGEVSGTLQTTVSHPGVTTSTIKAAAINNALISADILTAINSNGEAVTLNFPGTDENPLVDYEVATPTITQPIAGDTMVSGAVVLNTPIPTGTTFEAIVIMPDHSEHQAIIQPDGTYTVDTGVALVAQSEVQVKIRATNGEYTKDGQVALATVQADENTNPIENYEVATPTLSPATAGDTQVTGQVNLAMPIPEGTTFKAVLTYADNQTATADIGIDGSIVIPTRALVADEVLNIQVIATNGEYQRFSEQVPLVVSDVVATDPLEDYTVNAPVVNVAKAGDVKITGNVTLEQPIPTGTTFEATVKMPDGTTKTANVTENGEFSINTDALIEADVLAVKITAKNSIYTKDSSVTSVTVQPMDNVDPLADYEVATPTVDAAKIGDTSVSGSVTLNTPVPTGTTFEATVKYEDGTTAKASVDSNGDFVVMTDPLTLGAQLEVYITAVNGEYTKDGLPAMVMVEDDLPTNPLENYEVAMPVVNPVVEGDTNVTGQVSLVTPIPTGTTFEVMVTLADGNTKMGTLNSDGTFDVEIPAASMGDVLEVKVIANNGIYIKESLPVNVTVEKASEVDPLVDYEVATPMVNPAKSGDTTISGSVSLNMPIPEGTVFEAVVTLADGQTKVAAITTDGTFVVNTGTLTEQEVLQVKVVAKNGHFTKKSNIVDVTVLPAEQAVNPLEDYEVATPVVDPIEEGDTTVTGEVTPTQPLPDGTTFEVVVTLPDGTTQTGSLGQDGRFEIETGVLKAGDKVAVKVVAKNGDHQKDGKTITMTVKAKETGGSTDKPGNNNGSDGTNNSGDSVNGDGSTAGQSNNNGKNLGNQANANRQVDSNKSGKITGFLPQTDAKSTLMVTVMGIVLMIVVIAGKLIPKRKK